MFVKKGKVLLTLTLWGHSEVRLPTCRGMRLGASALFRSHLCSAVLWCAWHMSCQDHEGWPPLQNELLESSVLVFAALYHRTAPIDYFPSSPEASAAAFFICLWQAATANSLLPRFQMQPTWPHTSWLHDNQSVCTELLGSGSRHTDMDIGSEWNRLNQLNCIT